MSHEHKPEAGTAVVLKSAVESLLSERPEAGLDGEFLWPIDPRTLALLYRSNAEHSRAIHVKAEGAYGGGLLGAVSKIEDLCETGATELFVLLGLDVETYGNAFLQVIRNGDRIIGLRRLPAISMARFRDGFLQRVFNPDGNIRRITFSAKEVIHLRDLCPMGGRYAQPAWIGAEGMLELAWAATRYNAAFFKNNAMPEYAITFKGVTPNDKQKEAIREFFRNDFKGMDNAHRTLILTAGEEGTVEIKRLTADVKDGDFIKLMDAARDRIPIAHGTPPRILGIVSAGQLGGGGEVTGQLFTFEHLTLKPKRRRMLDQLRPLLRELGLRPGDADTKLEDDQVTFRALDLTPPDDDAKNLPDLVNAGILTMEEARALYPALANLPGDTGAPIERSAPANTLAALAAILARS